MLMADVRGTSLLLLSTSDRIYVEETHDGGGAGAGAGGRPEPPAA